MSELMSSYDYVNIADGAECPKCTSENLTTEGEPRFISTTELKQIRLCKTCGFTWQDFFSLISYRVV